MTEAQRRAIEEHGRRLLAIFPDATERDPVKLCKKLRRLETKAWTASLGLCNGEIDQEAWESANETVLDALDAVLHWRAVAVPVFVNGDARGYALKIRDAWMKRARFHGCGFIGMCTTCPKCVSPTEPIRLYTDMGGYGIIAPEIGKDGF